VRATERGKEAGSENRGPMYKNRIRGGVERGERARNREATMTKGRRWWKNSAKLINAAFPISYFDQLGVPWLAS